MLSGYRAPRPGQPQFAINYYILSFIHYILVFKIRFQPWKRQWATFPRDERPRTYISQVLKTQGGCSFIITVTLPRTSRLRNLEPSTLASLFFHLLGHAFTRFLDAPNPPPALSLFLVLVPSFLSIKPSSTSIPGTFEQTAAHQHAASADPTVCAALYPVHGESTNHWFHSAGVGPHAVNL